MHPDLPEWVLWIAGGAAAFVFYLSKLGWERGKTEKPFAERAAQVAAVVVDSKRLEELTAAIEGATLEVITTRKANDDREVRIMRSVEAEAIRVVRAFEKLTDEITEHREEMRRHGEKMAARR